MSTRLTGIAGPQLDIKAFLAGDITEAQVPVLVQNFGWTYGTAANQVNVIYADTITLTDGSNTTISMYDSGTYLDIFNRDLTMTALKLLYIKNRSTDSTLLVGGGASLDLLIFADTSDIIKVPSGGIFLYVNPSAAGVDITTNKNLKIADDGTGAAGNKYIDIIAMGLD